MTPKTPGPMGELIKPVADLVKPVTDLMAPVADLVRPVTDLMAPVNELVSTMIGRFLPTALGADEGTTFDFWRLPNDPDSPHVAAMRDLFVETFGMAPETFDGFLAPSPGLHRRLIVAARNHVIKGGIIYQMADNHGREPADQIDGGYIAFIATRRKQRARGAGRALLAFAHADFIVNHHTISRLIRLDPAHTAFFEAAGYVRTEGGGYGDMHALLDTSPEAKAAAQASLNGLMTLY